MCMTFTIIHLYVCNIILPLNFQGKKAGNKNRLMEIKMDGVESVTVLKYIHQVSKIFNCCIYIVSFMKICIFARKSIEINVLCLYTIPTQRSLKDLYLIGSTGIRWIGTLYRRSLIV